MPAKGKVSILWQIVFVVFVPVLDLWAFYRIRRLRRYLLFIYVPQIAVAIVIVVFAVSMVFEEDGLEKVSKFSDDLDGHEILLTVASTAIGLSFTILSIYLIATWSEKWNKKFEI